MSGSARRGACPLDGVRVLDLSRMIAGGVAGMLLADFGADVVKVEEPKSGDPLRQWTAEGQPFWWKVYARNKRYITLNLKSDEGRALLSRLIPKFDVVLESFVPGTLEKLGLGWDVLRAWNPRLVLVRISGWGQTGPASQRPGFGTLVEAASGFAAMNGEPDGAPIVPAFPLADMTSALYAVNAAMFALYHRDVHGAGGQVIDVSLFESLFSLLGPLPAEYRALGRVRERLGSRSKNAGPRGCYATSDGRYVAVSGSTPKMAERVLQAYGLAHLLQDDRFRTNEARVRHSADLDAYVATAIASRTLAENLRIIGEHELTSRIRTGSSVGSWSMSRMAPAASACTPSCRGCRRRRARFAMLAARSARITTSFMVKSWDSHARRVRRCEPPESSECCHAIISDRSSPETRALADRRRLGRWRGVLSCQR
jgi:crotonobetainyl-CoA:carnitine CoA-transferase CaiB-like acyl-CoA transferase